MKYRIPNGSPTQDVLAFLVLAALAGADGVRIEAQANGPGRIWATADGEEAELDGWVFDALLQDPDKWAEVNDVGGMTFVRLTDRGRVWLDRFRKVNKL